MNPMITLCTQSTVIPYIVHIIAYFFNFVKSFFHIFTIIFIMGYLAVQSRSAPFSIIMGDID